MARRETRAALQKLYQQLHRLKRQSHRIQDRNIARGGGKRDKYKMASNSGEYRKSKRQRDKLLRKIRKLEKKYDL